MCARSAHPNIRLFVYQGGLQSTEEAVHHAVPPRRDTVCLRSGVSSYENGLAASGETPGRGRAHDTGTAGRYTRSRRR